MSLDTSPELYWLTVVTMATGLMWIPYILKFIAEIGLVPALVDPTGEHPLQSAWAQRAKRAHANAVENLVIFAPLVLMVAATGSGDPLTAAACQVYAITRLAHFGVYVMATPVLRTLSFAVGVGCQAVLAMRLFVIL